MDGQSLDYIKARAFDALLEHADIGLALLDHNQRYLAIDASLAAANGQPVEQHLGQSVATVLPQLYPHLEASLQQALLGQRVVLDTDQQGHADHWRAEYFPLDTPTPTLMVLARNHSLEQSIQRSKEAAADLTRRVLDSLFAFVGMLTPDGTLIDANRSPLEAAGIELDDVVGKKFWDCYWWSYDPDIQAQLKEAVERVAAGEVVRYDVMVRMAGDSRMTIDFMLAPLYDREGRLTHLIPSANDVSDRVASEQQLRSSEDRFRRVFDSTFDGLALVDQQGIVQLMNQRACQILGNGAEPGVALQQLVDDEQRLLSALAQSYGVDAESGHEAFELQRPDGEKRAVELSFSPMAFEEGPRILVTMVDVTHQRLIQQHLRESLEEKVALLNEVHHRVKNNLQVVSSLLSLQSRQVPTELASYFADSQARIKAMALIHQLLYEQEDYDRIQVRLYLQRLIDLLKRSYSDRTKHVRIAFASDVKQCFLSLEQALPFGLLVNELITNALKHAFPNEAEGNIELDLKRQPASFVLRVVDDGIGLPDDFSFTSGTTLGVQLMPGLCAQMKGELVVVPIDQGSCFQLTFNGLGAPS
jgi:PAS domain S-box-containing protein